jgi:transposase
MWSVPGFADSCRVSRKAKPTAATSHDLRTQEPEDRLIEPGRAGRMSEAPPRTLEPMMRSSCDSVAPLACVTGRPSDRVAGDERRELRRLRRENKVLREEREIIRKAASWFARKTGSIPMRESDW